VGNILFDKNRSRAVAIIDLDTIGPGLLQHDIGDCLRSVCTLQTEKNAVKKTLFNTDLCRSVLRGYFRETGDELSAAERELIYEGLTTISFELGLRFFTDFLQSGVYFRNIGVEEILQRAVVQFSLLRSIYKQEQSIRRLIRN
jgi:hypothetical protein